MKIRVFQSDKGDCLLLTSADGKNMLADGGMAGSYRDHVASFLGRMRESGDDLDLVYVSHIDQDHIAGVLRMMDDAVDWKVHDFQVSTGNTNHRRPRAPRPPEVKAVWHNAFHEQVGDNTGEIEDMLAAESAVLSLRSESWATDAAELYSSLATSKAEAVRLSRRIGQRQLNIPLNEEYDGKLMFITDPADPIALGSMSITVIGPFSADLRKLRNEWNRWLKSKKGKRQIRGIRRRSREEEEELGHSEFSELLGPLFSLADELGDRSKVTLPNLASLMLLVEDGGHTVLMTGDGHWKDILDGLRVSNKLDTQDCIHVDVLKVQHHGSEHNWNEEFGRKVIAENYIFCGNGEHHNPDERVVEGIIDSRLGGPAKRSNHPNVGDPFKLWFNSSSKVTDADNRPHMRKLERLVQRSAAQSQGQMQGFFLKQESHFSLEL